MREISSAENKIFKHASQLLTKKYRDAYCEYLIEGPNLLDEAIKCGAEIETVFVSPDYDWENMTEEAEQKGFMLSENLFKRLSETETAQGVIAVVKKAGGSFRFTMDHGGNFVVLDRLQDPGNIGTIIRTADASGYGVLVMKGTADIYSSKVVRAAAGALFRVPIGFFDTVDELKSFTEKRGIRLCVTSMTAEKVYSQCCLSDTAIVIGNEGNGVSQEMFEKADFTVRIPMKGKTESLNAAVSAAILMYENMR